MRLTATLLLICVAFAGCADDSAPQEVEEDPYKQAHTTSTTGAISGVVVDQGIVPLAGATVVLSSGENATSDDLGQFIFENLEPNTYSVSASAAGFMQMQTTLTVTAGEVSTATIRLEPDGSAPPYHITHSYDGHMVAYGTIASFALHLVLQEAGYSICECEWDLPLDKVPETVVVEGFWEDSVPDPQGPQEYYLELFDNGINDCLVGNYVPSGFNYIVGGCKWDREGYRIALTGPFAWMAVEQSYQLFATTFYDAAAPAGWSFED